MLTKDYTKRCYASEALNDPWFKNAKATKVDDAIVKQTLNNMKKFNATSKLQQATMSMMVMNMASKKETA